MRKIKFKMEYVPLSDDRIERHKNFDLLMAAYAAHPKPSWKTRIFGNRYFTYTMGILTGGALSSLIWWNASHMSEKKLMTNETSVLKTEQSQMKSEPQQSANENFVLNTEEKKSDSNLSVTNKNESTISNKYSPLTSDSGSRKQAAFDKNQEARSTGSAEKAIATSSTLNEVNDVKKKTTSTSVKEKKKENASVKSVAAKAATVTNTNASLAGNPSSKNASENFGSGSEMKSQEGEDAMKTNASSQSSIDKSLATNSSGGNLPPQNPVATDTLTLNGKSPDSKTETPVSSLPEDSAKKGFHITLPKIDLNDEWNASKDAVSKTADSIGRKTGSFFSGLFKKDSTSKEQTSQQETVTSQPQDSFKHRFAQVSFVTPHTTDGENAKDYEHNISFNILQGYTGALDGVEIGGIANVERGYVTGAQFGGIANYANGNVKGVQFGGLVNHGKNLRGAQFGGLVNTATGNVHGAQIAGITNFVLDSLHGLQLGGIVNLSSGNKTNIGWQVAGVSNVSVGKLEGGQIAGVVNVASKITGVQIGTINVAAKMKGFQLGLINVTDSIDGDALGLISISSNGIHNLDVFGSEILYGSIGLKLGSPHIYNIFAVGAAPMKDTVRLGLGLGLGGHFEMNKVFINVDGVCWSIHNDNLRDWNAVNLWNQIRVMAGYQFAKGFAAYAGPTLNAHVNDPQYPAIAPYSIYDSRGTTNVTGWIGFVVGLQFF